MKTMGGRQYWGDVAFFHRWRIQQNVLTGHFRLLDGDDYRHASGTREQCQKRLDEITKRLKLPPMTGKSVILLHGIFRSSKSLHKLRSRLESEGYHVFAVDYPSTRLEIPGAADYLHHVIESLEGIDEINFVVHSMGGLVARAYLAKHQDHRIRRMVMMGVPNLGARMADHLRSNLLFRALYGPAGNQLGTAKKGLITTLPTPEFEFAVIAGSRGTLSGFNPIIPGDDDGTVSVASTRLPGASDFLMVHCLHSFIINNDNAIEATVRFVKQGRLREKGDPHPIRRPNAQRATDDAAGTGRSAR
jgi:pimeloyl-ACP methyl ester carboxylesterase